MYRRTTESRDERNATEGGQRKKSSRRILFHEVESCEAGSTPSGSVKDAAWRLWVAYAHKTSSDRKYRFQDCPPETASL